MFDDLRESAAASFTDEESVEVQVSDSRILGMTGPQRFIVSLLLFMVTCVVGSMMLIVFEKVVPPVF